MNHTHTWHVTSYVLLDLPDDGGYADRFLAWQCPCGQASWITGHIRLGEPLRTPAFWTRLHANLDDELHAQIVSNLSLKGEALHSRQAGAHKSGRLTHHPRRGNVGATLVPGITPGAFQNSGNVSTFYRARRIELPEPARLTCQ